MSYEGKGSVANSSQIWDGSKWVERSSGIVAPHDTTHSPVALYQLNESLDDTSGNALTSLTISDGTERYTEVLPGIRGFFFDGSTRLIVNAAETSLQITGDLTIEMLISVAKISTATQIFLTHVITGETEATNMLYSPRFSANSNALGYFAETGSGTNITYDINDGVGVGVVNHFAMVRSSNQITFYLNGEQIGATSTGLSAPSGGTSGRLYLGDDPGGGFDFTGVMASLKIMNSALTPAQIREEYNRTLGPALGKQNLFSYKSAVFNGINEYITMGDVLGFEYNQAFSVSCWFKTTDDTGYLVSKRGGSAAFRGWGVFLSGGAVAWSLSSNYSGPTYARVNTDTTSWNDGAWHHVCVTSSGSGTVAGMLVYVDGQLEATTPQSDTLGGNTIITTAEFNLGSRTNGSALIGGNLDGVAVHDKELSLLEVQWIYNSGRPQDLRGPGAPPNLVGWWTLGEDVSGTTAPDRSVNSNNGTLTNMTEAANITNDHPI